MKVLTLEYYADFSRFFSLIENECQKIDSDAKFLHVTLYLSGAIYSILHNKNNIYLPFVKNTTNPFSVTDSMENFIKYHMVLNSISIDKEKLLNLATRYYHALINIINEFKPDLIISSGDSRLAGEILKYIADLNKIKIVYFEQAPLGRTILDSKGVNANASFRSLNISNLANTKGRCYSPIVDEKYVGYKKYRFLDLLIEKLVPSFQSEDKLRPKRKKISNKYYEKLIAHNSIHKLKYEKNDNIIFLLILQVPDDVNMIYHSPYFNKHSDIIKSLSHALPEKSVLVVREHPLYKQLYEEDVYELISKDSRLYIDDSRSLNNSIDNSDVVIVNNSTVGIEALERGKSLVVLGNAYYDLDDICYKYKGYNLDGLLLKALASPKDKNIINNYLNHLFNNVFIEGHFRHKNGLAAKNIANRIMSNDL